MNHTDRQLTWVPASSAHGAEFIATTRSWMSSAMGGAQDPPKPPCFLLKGLCLSCVQAEVVFHACPSRAECYGN